MKVVLPEPAMPTQTTATGCLCLEATPAVEEDSGAVDAILLMS
jgi:hypothetical protein